MATLDDSTTDFPDVYQLENGDPIVGGAPNESTGAGMDNIPHLHLARRTRWLKAKVDTLLATTGALATTATAGLVRLADSVSSTATDRAATANAVKLANDNANSRVPRALEVKGGGLVTGGGALTASRTLTVTAASDADAVEGTRGDVALTPKSAKAALDARLDGVAALGVGQAWVDVTGQRQAGTVYVNDTGKPIMVVGKGNSSPWAYVQVSVDGTNFVSVGVLSSNEFDLFSFVVPAGHHYRFTAGAVNFWSELR